MMDPEANVQVQRAQPAFSPVKALRHSKQLGIDVPLLLIVIMLMIFGLLMLYSASWDYSKVVLGYEPMFLFKRQLLWLGIGVVIAFLLGWVNYHRWQKLAVLLMVSIIAGLIAVLLLNQVVNNATRTLVRGSIQPSEAAKLVTIIYLSVWLFARHEQLSVLSFGLIPLSIILGGVCGLIVLQPDLSAAATVYLMGGILFFLAGGESRQLIVFMVLSLLVGLLVFWVLPTGRTRLIEYMAGLQDITQAPTHLARALEAIVRGGWFGVGIGRSETKLTGLPVPPTDSIFAVVAEETGIFGSATLVVLYIFLLWRGLLIAEHAPDGLGRLLGAGLSLWIASEAFINMAVIVGLLPFAGNALPFISYGGSSLLVSLAAVGILMNISRLGTKSREQEERTYDAVVDLRRGYGRRRISRSGRP
jgi:cell division protein FtsW